MSPDGLRTGDFRSTDTCACRSAEISTATRDTGDGWHIVADMKKTSIYIEPEIDVALARQAAEQGVTKAEVIRQALRSAAAGSIGIKPRARGVFAGPPDLAANVDEHLTASGFGAP